MKKEKVIKVKLQKDYELVKPRKDRIRIDKMLKKKQLSYIDYRYFERYNLWTIIRSSEYAELARYKNIYFLTLYEEGDDDEDEPSEWYSTQNLGEIPASVALKIFKEADAEYR